MNSLINNLQMSRLSQLLKKDNKVSLRNSNNKTEKIFLLSHLLAHNVIETIEVNLRWDN